MNYDEIKNSSKLVLVEFYATWCPHCRHMQPIVEQVKEITDGRAAIYQFDIDQNQEAADELSVQSVPTFILYDSGTEVWRHSGEIEGNDLLGKIEQYS